MNRLRIAGILRTWARDLDPEGSDHVVVMLKSTVYGSESVAMEHAIGSVLSMARTYIQVHGVPGGVEAEVRVAIKP